MAGLVEVKRVKNAVLYADGTIRLDEVRFSYLTCYEARETTNPDGSKGSKKFGCVAIMPKATHREAKDLVIEELNKILMDKKKITHRKFKAENLFLRDGDTSGKEEYEDSFIAVTSQTEQHPPVVLKGRTPLPNDGTLFSGCYGSIWLRPWWQIAKPERSQPERINANFVGVQFKRTGEAFGSQGPSQDDILGAAEPDDGDLPVDDDDDDAAGL